MLETGQIFSMFKYLIDQPHNLAHSMITSKLLF